MDFGYLPAIVLLTNGLEKYPAGTMGSGERSRYYPGSLFSSAQSSMEKSIRVILANHHPIIRSDLRLLLERQPAVRVVGEAANGREALVLAEYKHPDIVLLDVQLSQINGIAAAREISSKNPSSGIIFVSSLGDEEYVSEALKAGARGYVLEDAVQIDLADAIRVVAGGGTFLSPAISSRPID
jgi:two-component system, NarL family, response regulator NreC